MKKAFYSILTLALVLGVSSCSSDDSSSSVNPDTVSDNVASGQWHVTLYKEGTVDQTSNFSGYNFTFGANDVLTAANGTNTYTGAWFVSDESDDDDSSNDDVDFDIAFLSPANFAELTEDWDILESTSTKLRLRHVSGGDGSTDLLTFEKH